MPIFNGAWPAILTPFNAQDNVDVAALINLCNYLLDKGVDGLYVNGSTGQGVYMSVAERKLVAETVTAAADGRVPVVVHVGSMNVPDACDLATHAAQIGADGISSILPPTYSDGESLFRYFAALAETTPSLPLLPYIFGATLDAASLLQRLLAIPSVLGTKYTGPDMFEFRQIVDLGRQVRGDEWSAFSGMDEQCLFAAMFGSCGNIGSTLNFMPGIYSAIHAAYAAGDIAGARDMQLRANKVTGVAISFGFVGSMREIMALLGQPCGRPRLPGHALPDERREALRAALEQVDFFELAAMSAQTEASGSGGGP